MVDIVDNANEVVEAEDRRLNAEVKRKAAMIPKGKPGYCTECEEHSWRLVGGRCAPCREFIKGAG